MDETVIFICLVVTCLAFSVILARLISWLLIYLIER